MHSLRLNMNMFWLVLVLGLASTTLLAQEKPVATPSPSPKPEAAEGPRMTIINVPERLRNSGGSLIIGTQRFELNQEKIEARSNLDPQKIEIYSSDQRLVDFQRGFISPDMLDDVRFRRFTAEFYLG